MKLAAITLLVLIGLGAVTALMIGGCYTTVGIAYDHFSLWWLLMAVPGDMSIAAIVIGSAAAIAQSMIDNNSDGEQEE